MNEIQVYVESNPSCYAMWRLPHFQNLQSLSLHRLGNRTDWPSKACMIDIAEVLLASPGLKHFGLSFVSETGPYNELLQHMIHDFNQERQKRQQSILRLESLHLGMGAMLWTGDRDLNPYHPPGLPANYLDLLTDLSYLTSLRLDNMHHFQDYPSPVPYAPIDPNLLSKAVNLRELCVERFGPDILRLVQMVHDLQSPSITLDRLAVTAYGRTLCTGNIEDDPDWMSLSEEARAEWYETHGVPIYSVPLTRAGHSWRRLCYSGPIPAERLTETHDILRDLVAGCTALEELVLPIHSPEELDILKGEVLPCLHRLHTLHIPWGFLEDLHSSLDPQSHRTPRFSRMSNKERTQWIQDDRENEKKHEMTRIEVVRDLFLCHQKLRSITPDMAPLRYVAINQAAYTLAASGTDDHTPQTHSDPACLPGGWSIVRVPRDEAMTVGFVGTLHDDWTFRLL